MKIAQIIEVTNMKKNQTNKLTEEIIRELNREDLNILTNYLSVENVNFIDRDNRSLIFHAIILGKINVINLCISHQAQINIQDKVGWYPLHYAAQSCQIEIAQLLIENEANIEAKDNYGNTALWRAVFSAQGKGDMIKFLLAKGANPNNPNNSGISPLKLAKTITNYDLLQYFKL